MNEHDQPKIDEIIRALVEDTETATKVVVAMCGVDEEVARHYVEGYWDWHKYSLALNYAQTELDRTTREFDKACATLNKFFKDNLCKGDING